MITLSLIFTFFILNACSTEDKERDIDNGASEKKVFMAGASVSDITVFRRKTILCHDKLNARTNGYYGYLPTPEQHELGGWGTWMGGSNKVQKNASVVITDRLLSMLNALKEGK